MPENNHQSTGQSTSSHMMKTTKRGRPFLKVRLCRFSTSIPGVDRWCRRHVLSLLGHARSVRYIDRIFGAHDSQAVLQIVSKFIHNVSVLHLNVVAYFSWLVTQR